ncbi:ABATE domain-containing protein [Streptomyces sp. CT34]|uniref:CGNR zinc finger domain-containing protein n=1 Tax=Streptomyces sp. CT34 TaxID=1553907 RepID=UPI0005BD7D00|nr:ABATE domain-containing protein [Streptomyces sp. CT34]
MTATGSAAADDWVFDGGRLCLDFVNTLRDRKRTPRETLPDPAALARWLRRCGLLGADTEADESDLAGARRLREAVDRCTRTVAADELPDAADLVLVNAAATAAPKPPTQAVIENGRLVPATPSHSAADTAGALGLVAQDAVRLILAAEVRQVRICGAELCGLRYVDRSPAGNRRWCSMSRCGNRTKVRLHTERGRRASRAHEDRGDSL